MATLPIELESAEGDDGSEVRPAIGLDVEQLIRLDPDARVSGTRHAEARRGLIRRAVAAGHCYVRTEAGGRIVAYVVLEYTFFENGFVSLLFVAAPHRRRGVGAELLRYVEGECQTPKLFVSTNASNTAMRALLRKLAYHPSGVVENLDEGDPELIFFKRLRPG